MINKINFVNNMRLTKYKWIDNKMKIGNTVKLPPCYRAPIFEFVSLESRSIHLGEVYNGWILLFEFVL